MPVTMRQVRAALNPDEPRYRDAASLGPEALPHLDALIAGAAGPDLAAKAAYLASLIDDPSAGEAVRRAAGGHDAVAIALLDDDVVGVRKTVLTSLAGAATPAAPAARAPLLERLTRMTTGEPEPPLRDAARRLSVRWRNPA